MNLLKKYYSMSTLEKLDKVDLQILRTCKKNAPTDHQRTGCTGKPFLHSGVRTPQNDWKMEDI